MQWIPTEEEIEFQRRKVFGPNPCTQLLRPCRINDGILRLDEDQKRILTRVFDRTAHSLAFFIPASGSGSRMLQMLYEYRNENSLSIRGEMEHFINMIPEFAFFRQLPDQLKKSILDQNYDIDDVIDHILDEKGLGLGKMPKGLIPFHHVGPFILTPFQEHLLQGSMISTEKPHFHFTIQKDYEDQITRVVTSTSELTGTVFNVSFSEQPIQTNSVAFRPDESVYYDDQQNIITRPSGHGALLPVLNTIENAIIFIKNIDNVQHFSRSSNSNEVWKLLGGMLIDYRKKAKEVYDSPTVNGLLSLNQEFQLFETEELENIHSSEAIRSLLNRPTRVCGMVKNEGQPGGGPFWVHSHGKITKQIVEKAQISDEVEQKKILLKSTHFNPVMIAASPISMDGEKFELSQFMDEDTFFIVHKKAEGSSINYLEQPGLWNGGMAFWNTLFVEIPDYAFSPVKAINDLLNPAHKE